MSIAAYPEQGILGSSGQNKELEIIEAQLYFADVDVSFFTLFRHAKTSDYLVVAFSTLSALAAGALIPVPAVCLPNTILAHFGSFVLPNDLFRSYLGNCPIPLLVSKTTLLYAQPPASRAHTMRYILSISASAPLLFGLFPLLASHTSALKSPSRSESGTSRRSYARTLVFLTIWALAAWSQLSGRI